MKKDEFKIIFHNPNTDEEGYSKYIIKKILEYNFKTIKESVFSYEGEESPEI